MPWVVNSSPAFIISITLLWNIWLGQDFQRKYMNGYGFQKYWIYKWGIYWKSQPYVLYEVLYMLLRYARKHFRNTWLIEGSAGNNCSWHTLYPRFSLVHLNRVHSLSIPKCRRLTANIVSLTLTKKSLHMIRLIIGFDKSCRPITIQFSWVKTISARLLGKRRGRGHFVVLQESPLSLFPKVPQNNRVPPSLS